MTTFVPRGYGAYPSYQFGLPNQYNNQYYYSGHGRQPTSFAPHYPTQPVYQPPMRNSDKYAPVPYFGPAKQPGLGTYAVMLYNRLDEQYRYEQHLRQLKKMEKVYWKMQANNIPPQLYSHETIMNYIKETKYVPYPVYVNPGAGIAGGGQGFFGGQNVPVSAAASLPPKIRVIFIPNGQSYAQQPYTGSLAMPPFLYNRMAQPLYSFPLPPPLPQVASLPLTPAVQQIVAQRYSNPVAVLPFPSNWPISQPALTGYPQVLQQQQQYTPQIPAPQPYIPPVPASYLVAAPQQQQCAPQPYIPPVPASYSGASQQQYVSQMPSVPAPPMAPTYTAAPHSSAPQTYTSPPIINVPPPFPTIASSFQPDAQVSIAAPALPLPPPPPPPLVNPYYSPAPQANLPVSVASDSSSSLLSAPALNAQLSSSNSTVVSSALAPQSIIPNNTVVASAPQYPYNSYPSICRACPPAPPPLNIPVTGYCWIQHCSACHHVALPNAYPNNRPVGGRNTPLLRQATVPQYVPEQSYQQSRPANPPIMMRPWLRKTPPLPPGGVVISDEYVYKDGSTAKYNYSQRSSRQDNRNSRKKYRSTTVTPRTGYGTNTFNARSVSPRKTYYNSNNSNNPNTNALQLQRPKGSKTVQSPSTSTTSTDLSGEYDKVIIAPTTQTQQTQQTTIPEPIAREARNVNLQYKYQPQELPTVYHVNRYLKSSSEASSLSTNTENKFHGRSPYLKNSNSITPNTEQEDDKPPRPPSHLKKSKDKVLIIREFTTSSPSTISTISSNMSFAIINKDEDSLSTTSTINEHKQEENDTLHRHIF